MKYQKQVFIWSARVWFFTLNLVHLATSKCTQCATLSINIYSNHTVANHSLDGYSLSKFQVNGYEECFTACIEKDCRCTSFNFQEKHDGRENSDCVLNYHTRLSKPSHFVFKPGYTYYEMIATENKVKEDGDT